ncbi:YrzA family protein [Halalkalibacterium ligniniphilum]|uniref:YrzA family protein n=1 Tax=Halalkalibacterium ligniniphilum TaxID=1134413 RepID=UPI00034C258C|nr:YrzA family protein [Halalkalibacterium ligniniphilum]
MALQLERIKDKIECFEATSLKVLEEKMNEQTENNKALLLEVHSVQHQVYIHPQTSQPVFTAVVHFKAKK